MTPTRSAASLALVLALVGAGSASASVVVLGNGDSILLDDLLDGGGRFIVGDKLFTIESWRSDVFNAGTISIIGFIALNPNQYGFRNIGFDIVGPFGDGTPGDTQVHEGNLQYTVEVSEDAYARGVRLCDVKSVFNGSSGGDGNAAINAGIRRHLVSRSDGLKEVLAKRSDLLKWRKRSTAPR